ncbi:OLC1v1009380C1 [Oldenlandia corymbosa var. corymbosa]|uniref:OLC1v1009380C1 n=1 Tax=Oldenlandia corymbosa var. corymbosa TaxID=529605 RepID=A0AAV1DNW4_OLDCO|nr:OLC1v1009380C1 [Oldenlandia corymbosa var. corymbosa]
MAGELPADTVARTFRSLVEKAEKKFARVRDAPSYARAPYAHYFHSVFKSYMTLWKYQQENRAKLTSSGLKRWEIGEIASRIGQLYFSQYMRTSEARYLIEAYVFYEAILHRKYFDEGSKKDKGVRFKELRFYARFLLVSLILNRSEMVKLLVDKFKALVDDSKSTFPDSTNFKEWKLVLQEILRFTKADSAFLIVRPLRLCAIFDSFPSSLPYVARFHAKKVLKFRDALLASYHKNEVKFAELTLDTFRMLQCLEWEPSGSFYQKSELVESRENGAMADHSAASGLIDINLAADFTDPSLPPNPRKYVLHRPSATQLLAVIATICEELPMDSVMLLYLSANAQGSFSPVANTVNARRSSKTSHSYHENNNHSRDNHVNGTSDSSDLFANGLWLGPGRDGGPNTIYPGDLIPFTRRPVFLIVDSDNSYAFKGLHGAERGEMAALLLSPLRPSFKNPTEADFSHSGSQFTLFLTAPLQAFCQLVGLVFSDDDMDVFGDADSIISDAFSEWEKILCTTSSLHLVWAQVLSDHFLRRLILRFIFCRAVLTLFCIRESSDQYLPVCLPEFPKSLSPTSELVSSPVFRLANHLKVEKCFHSRGTN